VGAFTFGHLSSGCAEVAIMDIRAILLVGGAGTEGGECSERFGQVPFAFLDVLGISVEGRIVRSLQRFGVSVCSVISDAPAEVAPFADCAVIDSRVPRWHLTGEQFWQAAEETFNHCADDGAELLVVHRIGAYAEVDYEEMIQHHLDHHNAVTQAIDSDGTGLDLFVLSASARLDAAELFQSRLLRLRRESLPFRVAGYVNHLQKAADLRRLAMDGLLARNAVVPQGIEIRPGIWLGRGAQVHRKARVVAPAYIGANAKVRASALVTRGTAIERYGEVDCGTVLENTTVLQFSSVGAGLDAMHCVVGFHRLSHLVRNIEVDIHDTKLVGMVPLSPLSRLAGSTAALFAFIPKEIYQGLVSPFRRKRALRSAEASEEAEPSLEGPALEAPASNSNSTEFPSNFAVVRRYGDH